MEDIKFRFQKLLEKVNPDDKKSRVEEIKKESEDPFFWQDHIRAGEMMKELSDLQKDLEEFEL